MVAIISGVVFFAVFIGLALYKFESSSRWEKTTALITKSDLGVVSQGMMASSNNSDNRISYEVNIEYQYSVNGVKYTGTGIYAGIGKYLSDKSEASNLIDKHYVGSKSEVYYNPNKHSDSALYSSKGFAWSAIFVVSIIICLGVFIFSFVSKKLDF